METRELNSVRGGCISFVVVLLCSNFLTWFYTGINRKPETPLNQKLPRTMVVKKVKHLQPGDYGFITHIDIQSDEDAYVYVHENADVGQPSAYLNCKIICTEKGLEIEIPSNVRIPVGRIWDWRRHIYKVTIIK